MMPAAETSPATRPPIASVVDLSALAALDNQATTDTIEAALIQVRESLPLDFDALSRQTLRATIRAQYPDISAAMIDAALVPPPSTTTDTGDRPRASQATRLVDLALAAGVELWHSTAGDPHVTIPIDGHREHHRLASRPVRDWLARRHYQQTGGAPGSQAIVDALAVLGGMARHDGAEHEVHVRVGARPGCAYLDLGDPTWRTLEITPAGWYVDPDPRVRMVRSRGMLALPMPTRGGHIDALREVLPSASADDYRLIVGWLLGALRPTGPYPLLALTGEQGSGKSTTARVVRRLIDPHLAELRAEPRVIDDLMIAASRSRVVALDNLTHLPAWLSDALCRLSTGGALTRRELYTDQDEVIIEAMRPTIVTSIADVVTRGDLLDRAIVVTLPTLPEGARLTEAELWRRFDAIAPGVLGALLDAVVVALAHEAATTIDELPRMADWARWITAAEPALGWPAGSTLAAYREMRGMAVEMAIEGDPLAAALRRLSMPWRGTSAELLAALTPAGRLPRGWPESPRAMAAALRRLAPGLRRVDVEIAYRRMGHDRDRIVTIDRHTREEPKTPSASSAPSTPAFLLPEPADDGADDLRTVPSAEPAADDAGDRHERPSAFASAQPSADSAPSLLTRVTDRPIADDADDQIGHSRQPRDPWAGRIVEPPGSREAADRSRARVADARAGRRRR